MYCKSIQWYAFIHLSDFTQGRVGWVEIVITNTLGDAGLARHFRCPHFNLDKQVYLSQNDVK